MRPARVAARGRAPDLRSRRHPLALLQRDAPPGEMPVDGLKPAAMVEHDVVVEGRHALAPVEVGAVAELDAEDAAVERREDGDADLHLPEACDDRILPRVPVVALAPTRPVAHTGAGVEVEVVGQEEV